jgi:hypothetical protein
VLSAGTRITHERLLKAIARTTSSLGSPLHEKLLFWRFRFTVSQSAMSEATAITASAT